MGKYDNLVSQAGSKYSSLVSDAANLTPEQTPYDTTQTVSPEAKQALSQSPYDPTQTQSEGAQATIARSRQIAAQNQPFMQTIQRPYGTLADIVDPTSKALRVAASAYDSPLIPSHLMGSGGAEIAGALTNAPDLKTAIAEGLGGLGKIGLGIATAVPGAPTIFNAATAAASEASPTAGKIIGATTSPIQTIFNPKTRFGKALTGDLDLAGQYVGYRKLAGESALPEGIKNIPETLSKTLNDIKANANTPDAVKNGIQSAQDYVQSIKDEHSQRDAQKIDDGLLTLAPVSKVKGGSDAKDRYVKEQIPIVKKYLATDTRENGIPNTRDEHEAQADRLEDRAWKNASVQGTSRQDIPIDMSEAIQKTVDQIPKHVLAVDPEFPTKITGDASDPNNLKEGLLSKYGKTVTLGDAEKIITDLNAQQRLFLRKNNVDQATAINSDPEFAAKFNFTNNLRNQFFDMMEATGDPNAKAKRADFGAISQYKDALGDARQRNDFLDNKPSRIASTLRRNIPIPIAAGLAGASHGASLALEGGLTAADMMAQSAGKPTNVMKRTLARLAKSDLEAPVYKDVPYTPPAQPTSPQPKLLNQMNPNYATQGNTPIRGELPASTANYVFDKDGNVIARVPEPRNVSNIQAGMYRENPTESIPPNPTNVNVPANEPVIHPIRRNPPKSGDIPILPNAPENSGLFDAQGNRLPTREIRQAQAGASSGTTNALPFSGRATSNIQDIQGRPLLDAKGNPIPPQAVVNPNAPVSPVVPPELATPEEKVVLGGGSEKQPLPDYVLQQLKDEGKSPNRQFNDVDMSRQITQDALANDPIIMQMKKYEPALAERALRGDLSNDEVRGFMLRMKSAQAQEHGVTFNGMQNGGGVQPDMPMFTDPKTKSSFMVKPDETLPQAIERSRSKFGSQAEATTTNPEQISSKLVVPPESKPLQSETGSEKSAQDQLKGTMFEKPKPEIQQGNVFNQSTVNVPPHVNGALSIIKDAVGEDFRSKSDGSPNKDAVHDAVVQRLSGDGNASLRQDIIENLTGQRPPKAKAGVTILGNILGEKLFSIPNEQANVSGVFTNHPNPLKFTSPSEEKLTNADRENLVRRLKKK